MTDWQPIETCPREEGKMYLVARADGSVDYLRWKTNQRMVSNIEYIARGGASEADREWVAKRAATYFGDPNESDDYDCALVENSPTHWLPVPTPPSDSDTRPKDGDPLGSTRE